MSEESNPSLEVIAPVFTVSDMSRALAFYRDGLGFSVAYEWTDEPGKPVNYAILRTGHCEIHLTHAETMRPGVAYIFVAGISGFYDAVRARGIVPTQELKDWPWEMREFEATDPDGNRLVFGEHLSRLDEAKT